MTNSKATGAPKLKMAIPKRQITLTSSQGKEAVADRSVKRTACKKVKLKTQLYGEATKAIYKLRTANLIKLKVAVGTKLETTAAINDLYIEAAIDQIRVYGEQ